ncbi:hypothetical protein GGR57DRAFT_455662 [Xylariaceae sp. FL1272]|nr:hypothetical protein GGR57DRAFT_455662 [Xylariaceae sp. FL1272]
MHASSLYLLPSLLGLATAKPISRQSSPSFTITDVSATYPYPIPPYGLDEVDSHLTLSVSFPSASDLTTTLSTTCTISWPKGTPPAPSSTWTPCSDSTLEFRLPENGWTADTHFTVEFWETTSSEGYVFFSLSFHLIHSLLLPKKPQSAKIKPTNERKL